MMRSTLEWLMSRSCQRATFSSAATALPRIDAGEAAEPFAGDRVALVRHGGTAFLAGGEKLLDFEHFGALQMAELRRPAVDARGDQGQRRVKFRVAVALDDLGGERRGLQAESLADLRSTARIEMRVRADRAAELADADALAHLLERSSARPNSSYISASFSPKVIGSAWMPWLRPIIGVILCSPRLSAIDLAQIRADLRAGCRDASVICTASVVSSTSDDVSPWCIQRRPGRRSRDVFEKGDDVVIRALLDLRDLADRKRAASANLRGILLRNRPDLRHRLAGERLDFEPDLVLALLGPELAHLRRE